MLPRCSPLQRQLRWRSRSVQRVLARLFLRQTGQKVHVVSARVGGWHIPWRPLHASTALTQGVQKGQATCQRGLSAQHIPLCCPPRVRSCGDPNCETCSSAGTCIKCMSSSFGLNKTSGGCQPCAPGCTDCSRGAGQCASCDYGYTLLANATCARCQAPNWWVQGWLREVLPVLAVLPSNRRLVAGLVALILCRVQDMGALIPGGPAEGRAGLQQQCGLAPALKTGSPLCTPLHAALPACQAAPPSASSAPALTAPTMPRATA